MLNARFLLTRIPRLPRRILKEFLIGATGRAKCVREGKQNEFKPGLVTANGSALSQYFATQSFDLGAEAGTVGDGMSWQDELALIFAPAQQGFRHGA